jgi:hypothetical protein
MRVYLMAVRQLIFGLGGVPSAPGRAITPSDHDQQIWDPFRPAPRGNSHYTMPHSSTTRAPFSYPGTPRCYPEPPPALHSRTATGAG